MAKRLKIQQVRSTINCLEKHKRTMEALGLHRIRQIVVHPDNPQTRGMVTLVRYLVRVEEVEG
jgi:large subunit ribosomal protein L30